MEAQERYVLWEMTWPELEAAMAEIRLVVIPVGATEQHGPHATFATDAVRAYEFSLRLAERLYPEVLVVPVMPFGVSPHHMTFPGTITLSGETFMQVLYEVVESLAEHGFERFLFVNGHGGNRPALELPCSGSGESWTCWRHGSQSPSSRTTSYNVGRSQR